MQSITLYDDEFVQGLSITMSDDISEVFGVAAGLNRTLTFSELE